MANNNKISCIKCKKEFTVSGFGNHKNKLCIYKEETLFCTFCNKECKSKKSLESHSRLCKQNPNRKIFLPSGNIPWNKGLTKETDDRILFLSKKTSKTLKEKYSSGFRTIAQSKEFWNEERRNLKSREKIEHYKNFPENHPNRKLSGNRKKITYPERVAYDWMIRNNVSFEHQKKIDKYFVDFCIGNIIIEIDGERWHSEGNEKDLIRDLNLKKLGYEIFRIKSKENIEKRLEDIFPLRGSLIDR